MVFGKLKYLVLDVDGTLTDSGIYYDINGNELKKFSTKDAAGIFAARKTGVKIIVITGRECKATVRRMEELNIEYLFQGIKNKAVFLRNFMEENNIKKFELGYIGDDLNDLNAMKMAGFVGCPKNSCKEVLQIASYVSNVNGGEGAVREIIEHMMREENLWEKAVQGIYGTGT